MEPEGSLPHSQVPAVCPYPEPAWPQSIPPHPTSWRPILILSSHLRLGFLSGFFPSGFPSKTLYTPVLSTIRATCPFCMYISQLDTFLRWGVVSASPNLQAGAPPLVGCPRLVIQYIRSYPPYLDAVPPSATWGHAMPWWQDPLIAVVIFTFQNLMFFSLCCCIVSRVKVFKSETCWIKQ